MDRIIMNTRERPLTSDLNDMQALSSRSWMEIVRWLHTRVFDFRSTGTTAYVKQVYGLRPQVSSTMVSYVTIAQGVLMQESSTLAPLPETLEHQSLRIGVVRSQLTISLPVPGAATWYLLEAQVSETTALSEVRDIMDEDTGVFEGTLVAKRKECGITTQWVAGSASNLPLPSGGDWVPLFGVLVQSTGTIADTADQFDLRPMAREYKETRQGWSRAPRVPILRTVSTTASLANNNIKLAVEEAVTNIDMTNTDGGGISMSWHDSTQALDDIDVTSATYLEPGTVLSANTWYYLYLCPWADVAPVYNSNQRRGVLILSSKAPESNGLYNGTALNMPNPFGNATVLQYLAPCVGSLFRNNSNDGWFPMRGGNGRYEISPGALSNLYGISVSSPLAIPAILKPVNAHTLIFQLFIQITGGPADPATVLIGRTGFPANEEWVQCGAYVVAGKVARFFNISVPYDYAQEVQASLSAGTLSVLEIRLAGFYTRG